MSIHRTVITQSEHYRVWAKPGVLSFWGPVMLSLHGCLSLVGREIVNKWRSTKGALSVINHTLLQVWHLALVWRVLWFKCLLWLRPTFRIQMEKALALLAIHSWKFLWSHFWWCPLGWMWKLHLGATFLSLWGECGVPRPVLGSLGVPFRSALPALCPLCNVFLQRAEIKDMKIFPSWHC